MNCDQVFDVLTRGPFPNGQDDAEVESHLSDCPGCRRLATALQPAVELFHEALDFEERADLPGYWGEHLEACAPAADLPRFEPSLATRLARGRRSNRRWQGFESRGTSTRLVSLALVLLVVACVSTMLNDPPQTDHVGQTPPRMAAVGGSKHGTPKESASPAAAPRNLLASLCRLEGCRSLPALETANPQAIALAEWNHACCTECHNASQPHNLSHGATIRLAQHCRTCHLN